MKHSGVHSSLLVILFVPLVGANAAPPEQDKPTPSVMQLQVGNIMNGADEPIKQLSAAMSQYPHVRVFRVNWYLQGGDAGGWPRATVLYDRVKKTAQFYGIGGQGYHEHVLYTGVTESVIHQVVLKYSDPSGGSSDAFFDTLPDFGCKRHDYGVVQARRKA